MATQNVSNQIFAPIPTIPTVIGVKELAEKPSNQDDTRSDAFSLGILTSKSSFTGDLIGGRVTIPDAFVGNKDPQDFYKFRSFLLSKLSISLKLDKGNANLFLTDAAGNVIASSTNKGSTAESIEIDYLTPGEYFLEVRKASRSVQYDLTTQAAPVERAEASVTVERIRAIDSFDPLLGGGAADFFVEEIFLETRVSGKSETFFEQNDVRPNFSFTQAVDPSDPIIRGSIAIAENDAFSADVVDVETLPTLPLEREGFTYNPIKDEVIRFSEQGEQVVIGKKGETIFAQGDGRPNGGITPKRAALEYRVDYKTFTGVLRFVPIVNRNASVLEGNARSNTLVGQDEGGILDGGKGQDYLLGKGGNDALLGGFGSDTMRGGQDSDILWGDQGRDTYMGNTGYDTFVLDLTRGVDVIEDFRTGKDTIGLSDGLVYEEIDIRRAGRNADIYFNNQKLGIVENVRPADLTENDFVQISYTTIKGVETPFVVI